MKHVVAAADEIPPGDRRIVEVAGRSIGVFNLGGEYFALRNRCPHQGGALCEGKLWGVLRAELPGDFDYEPSREILACPWHGWEFHLRTGQSWCAPERLRVRRYPVTVEAGSALEHDFHVDLHTDRITLQVIDPPASLDREFEYTDLDQVTPGDYYYVRITQLDGAQAFSSPFWVGTAKVPPGSPVAVE